MKKKNNAQPIQIERFNPSLDFGLTDEQVNQRINEGLTNCTGKKYSKSYLNIFYNNFCTFFNLLGLIVFIALLAVGAQLSNFFFVVVFLANIAIGIIQEIRAKICIDRLSLVSNKSIKVIREAKTIEITPKDIVLDDILVLGLGSQIPTDCIILDGNVEVNEALLTGESDAVKKTVNGQLLAGSFIVSGTCVAIATSVGNDNYVQKLSAKAKQYKKPRSELMNSLKFIIKCVGMAIVPIATLFMLKSTLISGVSVKVAILKTSTVIIGMIPSGMILLTSLALAVGIIKLATQQTLVQDLYSLEMLARVDTICFDKTGTITDGKMNVVGVDLIKENTSVPIEQIVSSMLSVLKDNNQTAIALENYFGHASKFQATKVLPFNSKRKLSAVTFNEIGTYAFGAPEFILNKEKLLEIENQINEYAKKGLRVLVLAKSPTVINDNSAPNDFEAVALITIVDHIRDDAYTTVKWFKENGVAVKVISGDNPITVSEVSKRVGIENAEKYISLEGLSDQEVYDIANQYTVFGRVSPEQKAILVKAMKDAGHITAMTGDGVNDILALKEADCAISVASGSEAARNISHLVLMNNNFNCMPKVVYEGRRVINNVQSSASLYLMKTFFTMIMAIITMCYMDTYPFELPQMILLEVFVIGAPSFFLSLQANDKKVEGKFISYVIGKSLPSALLMVMSVMIVEISNLSLNLYSPIVYTTLSVFALTISGVINLFFICRPLNKFRTFLFLTIFLIILTILAVAMFNGLSMFGLVPLFSLKTLYWYQSPLLIIAFIILLDIPLSFLFQYLFEKVGKLSKLKREKSRQQ